VSPILSYEDRNKVSDTYSVDYQTMDNVKNPNWLSIKTNEVSEERYEYECTQNRHVSPKLSSVSLECDGCIAVSEIRSLYGPRYMICSENISSAVDRR
jgi:hypothetical protein